MILLQNISISFIALRQRRLQSCGRKHEAEHVPIILRETEQFLATMLTIIKPKRILEIGCAVGYSSMFFAAQSDAEIVTVEKDPDVFETASRNILRMGYQPRITVLCGDGEEKIGELRS